VALKERVPVKNDRRSETMKKSLTYTVIAVLLGVVLMFVPLLPFWAFPVQIKTDTYTERVSPTNFAPQNLQESSSKSEFSAGIMPHYPMDAISVGLMLTFSLIFAFIVSLQLKKRAT
jgi:hypothetical protein